MFGLEKKFTAYSGTVLANLQDCTEIVGDQIFYKKANSRFLFPHHIFFTPKFDEAAEYANWAADDLYLAGWDASKEFLSQYMRRPRQNTGIPIILQGELNLWRRYVNHWPLERFPLSSVYVLPHSVTHDTLRISSKKDWISLFTPRNPSELLEELTQIK